MRNRVLIIGANSQDGAWLSKLLNEKDIDLYCTVRHERFDSNFRLNRLGIKDNLNLRSLDLHHLDKIDQIIADTLPNQIYFFASNTFTVQPDNEVAKTIQTNTLPFATLFESVRDHAPDCKIFVSNSIFAFDSSCKFKINNFENEFHFNHPNNIYALSKLYVGMLSEYFKDKFGMLIYNGILSNHESKLRGKEFVTQKIILGIANILRGNQFKPLELGNLNAERDWSDSRDFVEGFTILLNDRKPGNYIFASGKKRKVRDFLETALNCANLSFNVEEKNGLLDYYHKNNLIVRSQNYLYREKELIVKDLPDNYPKDLLNRPLIDFKTMINDMIEGALKD